MILEREEGMEKGGGRGKREGRKNVDRLYSICIPTRYQTSNLECIFNSEVRLDKLNKKRDKEILRKQKKTNSFILTSFDLQLIFSL